MTTEIHPSVPADTDTDTDEHATTTPPMASSPPLPPLDEDWLSTGPEKGVRVRLPAAVMVLVAVACLGMAGGARLAQRNATIVGPGGFAGRQGALAGGTGAAGGFGAAGGATAGTVKSVEGNTVTLLTSNGQTVKVTIGPDTTLTKSGGATVADIVQGETLVVRGTAGSDGTTTAQSVTIGSPDATNGGTAGAPTDGAAPQPPPAN